MAIRGHPYLPWVPLGLWDYAVFAGIPLVCLMVAGVRRRASTPLDALSWSLILTLAVLALSGTSRGENGRMWLFLTPCALIAAVGAFQRAGDGHYGWLLISLAANLLAVCLFLRTMVSALPEVPPAAPQVPVPMIEQTADLLFDGRLRLTGFGGRVSGDALILDVRWKVERGVDQPCYFAVIPVAPDGTAYTRGRVYQPFESLGRSYPATCWRPGQEIVDRIIVPLGDDRPDGNWWASLSLYTFDSYEQVEVVDSAGRVDVQAGLGPLPAR